MELLVVYDVSTETPAGSARLRRVARICQAYGQRVQKSVFECVLPAEQAEVFRHRLLKEIDVEEDSLRIYRLREPHSRYTFIVGKRPGLDIRGPLVI